MVRTRQGTAYSDSRGDHWNIQVVEPFVQLTHLHDLLQWKEGQDDVVDCRCANLLLQIELSASDSDILGDTIV